MSKIFVMFFILLECSFINVPRSRADLSSPIYSHALQLYQNSEYAEAGTAFELYESVDQQWLAENLNVKFQIDSAIIDCKNKTSAQTTLNNILHNSGSGTGDITRIPSH